MRSIIHLLRLPGHRIPTIRYLPHLIGKIKQIERLDDSTIVRLEYSVFEAETAAIFGVAGVPVLHHLIWHLLHDEVVKRGLKWADLPTAAILDLLVVEGISDEQRAELRSELESDRHDPIGALSEAEWRSLFAYGLDPEGIGWDEVIAVRFGEPGDELWRRAGITPT